MKWTVIESTMKMKRSGLSGVILNDGVTFLVTGGSNGGTRLSSCEQLDTTTMTWSDAPSIAKARSSHCTVLYKMKAVVIGGVDENGVYLSWCEEYDSTRKAWSLFPPLTAGARYDHGACVLNDQIYVCGGRVNRSPSNHVEIFDGVRWSVLDSHLSAPRWAHACVVFEGKVVVLGGGECKDVEVYDETEMRWCSDIIPQMSIKRMALCSVSF